MKTESKRLASGLTALLLALLMVGSTTAQVPGLETDGTLAQAYIQGYDPATGHEVLLSKAEPVLAGRIGEGQTTGFDAILTGPAHSGLRESDFPDRAAAMRELDARAAPYFDLVEAIATKLGGEVVASWSAANAIKVSGDLEMLQVLASVDTVRHIALDYDGALGLVQFEAGPMPVEGVAPSNSEGRKMLEAEDIWAAGFEGEGISIAVIDTGIDPSHEAFKFANGTSRVVDFVDCYSGGCDNVPAYDDNGHGTHVSGSAAGSDDYVDPDHGAFQERGVAPKAEIYGVKFLSRSGGGSFQGAMDSLQWSFDTGVDLTSNSWGGGCSASSSVVQMVNQFTDLGMLSVFAAGNSGSGGIGGPACADKALSVGAVDKDYDIAYFSSRGPCSDPTTDTGSRICPDVVAKGVAVRSAIPRSGAANSDPSGYKTWQGTSMATPHIAGAVALIEEMKRAYDENGDGWDTPSEAEKEILKLTALDLGSSGPDNSYGWGHVKLLPILAMLESSDEAKIIDNFAISHDVVRLTESTTLSFSVRNLGGATATGDFDAALEHPDGTVEVLADETVSLALLDGASVTHVVTVEGDLQPGVYNFTGSFDYTWENETGVPQTGSVSHYGLFEVKRVFLDMDLAGLDETTAPGVVQNLDFTISSTGNEPSYNTKLEVTLDNRYQFLPGNNYDPADENTLYADPTPDRVVENTNRNRITLIWDVGDLPEGDSFSFTTNLLPVVPGEHRFLGVGKFQDGAGSDFGQTGVWWQTIGV